VDEVFGDAVRLGMVGDERMERFAFLPRLDLRLDLLTCGLLRLRLPPFGLRRLDLLGVSVLGVSLLDASLIDVRLLHFGFLHLDGIHPRLLGLQRRGRLRERGKGESAEGDFLDHQAHPVVLCGRARPQMGPLLGSAPGRGTSQPGVAERPHPVKAACRGLREDRPMRPRNRRG
jgi:hypothetical protein